MDAPTASASSANSPGPTPPPPLASVAERDTNLASRLVPWLQRFSSCATQWARLASHDERLGVLIELCVDVTDIVLDEDDEFEHLLQLREAIDLVQLTLAVEPSALNTLLRTSLEEDSRLDNDAIDAVVAHGARTELRLRFEFKGIKTRLLAPQLATHFIQRLGQTVSTNTEFRTLRRVLVIRLGKHEKALKRTGRLPIPITLDIDSDEIEAISLLDADDFFVYLASFATQVVENQRATPNPRWAIDTQLVPLRVDGIYLTLRRFCITHRVAQAAKSFMNAGVPVQLKRLNLDPRLISCAADDVRDFVATLTTGATYLRIDTGMDLNEDFFDAIDEQDQDRCDTIRVILDAVANVEHVRELNLTGILVLCISTLNRQQVWRSLFGHILSRAVPPATIAIDDGVVLVNEDRECFQKEAAHWQRTHPEKKLFIKHLRLRLIGTELDVIEQLLQAVDDAESVEITNRDGLCLPPRILYRLLSYPRLKKLTLARLIVPSMDIFDPSVADENVVTKPALEELVLEDVILEDRSSMHRFLEKLRWDATTPSVLATSLRHLSLTRVARWSECYVSDPAALESLERVLATNRVLGDVRMMADYSAESVIECERSIRKYHNTTLPASSTSCPSEIAKARTLAFLSVIRGDANSTTSARCLLDAVAVNRILAFTGRPHQLRKAVVLPWEDF